MQPLAPILTLSCPDRSGIVAAVAGYLTEAGCNIVQSAQFGDRATGKFFMRVEFDLGASAAFDEIRAGFSPIGRRFQMEWRLYDGAAPVRTVLMASKHDHCLVDILHRVRRGELNLDVRRVISNHREAEEAARLYGAPFTFAPVDSSNRAEQEDALLAFVAAEDIELVVLARYMQILSDRAASALSGRAINIHHSFLPSFKGAKPYHQAFDRGVKLIGATAHFVTADLDEGPIIEQEAERVDHAMTVADLIRIGRDVERRTLAQAVRWFGERRILLNGAKTVTFR